MIVPLHASVAVALPMLTEVQLDANTSGGTVSTGFTESVTVIATESICISWKSRVTNRTTSLVPTGKVAPVVAEVAFWIVTVGGASHENVTGCPERLAPLPL